MTFIKAFFSFIFLGYVLVREGVVTGFLDDQDQSDQSISIRLVKSVARLIECQLSKDKTQSENISKALNRLGPSWVKLGQFLATRPDIVGKSVAMNLELLQDRMDSFPIEEAKKKVELTIGAPIHELFIEFGPAEAAASVAQVHKAKIETPKGIKTVAVKVIRPDIRTRFAKDLQLFYVAAHAMEYWFKIANRLRLVQVIDMLAMSIKLEMDLRFEAAAFSEMGENIENDKGFRVPSVNWDRTGRDCLTMDWVKGIKLTRMECVREQGFDSARIANRLNQSFLLHALRDGFFHADMHPGNLFIDENSDVVAVDMGITGRLKKAERRYLAEILYGFITRNYKRVAEVHFEAGYVSENYDIENFAQAIRAIGEPIHGQSAEKVSIARLLTLLFEVTELFDMKTQPQLLLLQKTMVLVEGVARKLDPEFNMWQSAAPVVKAQLQHILGPVGCLDDARQVISAVGQLAQLTPDWVARAEKISSEIHRNVVEGGCLDKRTIHAMKKNRYGLYDRFTLWGILLSLLYAIWTFG
ncbi:2-polyprenylphenol 6-hydroxylase [Candidatus Endowatersipora endosymbiont of Watersipora subatra]|uniref:2-polyprenylphenol 6-hydroxylase n=1 Tax=Candidatus Endowatersipora endosymbiont of Watersipora subatra TaxID=3077946 RepID=UPI00312C833B